MSYTALYRKWRPVTFDDVRGQDAIVRTLKNQINTGRIGHAYLFCGTRGTGKTSIAKIFARAVNCESPSEGNPCNKCTSCTHILEGSSINVFEIDAAGNNGVDNIRDIKEQVEYPPTEGRYKVYIIDEVHMLSTGAFNALLKTLEEPPSYVIFILATTDPQKIPQTILSRCQRYDFRRIGTDTIFKRLCEIRESEAFEAEDKALRFIASRGDGSMRDAVSLLDRCLAFRSGEILSYEDVLGILGATDQSAYSELFNAVADKDPVGALVTLNNIISGGSEVSAALTDFILYLRNLLITKSIGVNSGLTDVSEDEEEKLLSDSRKAEKDDLIKMISRLSELANRIRFSPQKRILFEAEIISLIYGYSPDAGPAAEIRTPAPVPQGRTTQAAAPFRSDNIKPVYTADEALNSSTNVSAGNKTPERAPELKICSDALSSIRENWSLLVRELSGSNKVVFQETELEEPEPGVVTVIFTNSMNYKLAATNKSENGLKKLGELSQERLNIKVRFNARLATAGQARAISDKNRITEEELSKIHFRIDRQEE